MIRVVNRSLFKAQVSAWTEAVRTKAEQAAVGMAKAALRNVTLHSPQYSGQFAASWNLSIGTPVFTSRQPTSGTGIEEAYHEESAPAIGIAMYANEGALKGFKLGQKIYLANSVSHDEPYSFLIESNQINFRSVNVSKGRTMGRAYSMLTNRYASIGKAQLAELVGV